MKMVPSDPRFSSFSAGMLGWDMAYESADHTLRRSPRRFWAPDFNATEVDSQLSR
jgi:hypothetical protein